MFGRIGQQTLATLSVLSLLSACEMTPIGGSFAHASADVGKSFKIEWPRRISACANLKNNCFERDSGNFTADNAMFTVKNHIVYIHLVFDDGKSGWMLYNDFTAQQFTDPVQTRRVFRYGMTPGEIETTWGKPETKSPEPCSGTYASEIWSYANIGYMKFIGGKVYDLNLEKALLADN